jgi:hypothetical protein
VIARGNLARRRGKGNRKGEQERGTGKGNRKGEQGKGERGIV